MTSRGRKSGGGRGGAHRVRAVVGGPNVHELLQECSGLVRRASRTNAREMFADLLPVGRGTGQNLEKCPKHVRKMLTGFPGAGGQIRPNVNPNLVTQFWPETVKCWPGQNWTEFGRSWPGTTSNMFL